MNAEQYLEYIKPSLEEAGIKINISDDLGGYGGWFSEEEKELCVWKHNPIFFATLIHEYCHFLQYRDKYDSLWSRACESTDLLFGWLEDGEDMSYYLKRKAFRGSIEVEWDCENMTIAEIKKHNIDIDTERYSRMSSAYLFSYHTTLKKRTWPGPSIYTDEIVENCPPLQELEFYYDKRNIPKTVWKLLLEKYNK